MAGRENLSAALYRLEGKGKNMNLDRLNDKQREAATCIEGPLLVLAGAGSGKTSTMTHRIAYMVEQGISPYNILAVTFTNKAATEMRERVEKLVGNTGGMWIMTFHAMCLRILRSNAEIIGYDSNFVIYDTQDQKTLVRNILKSKGINNKDMKPQYLLSIISKSKEKEITPKNFFEFNDENPRTKVIHTVYSEYQKELASNNAMDFDDLLLNTLRIFERDERTLMGYQDRFRYIMVDEYQDTNTIQYKLIKMLSEDHHNLCVVGDDDQCIYQWRGADIKNILGFEKDFPEAKIIKLEQNYRSVGNIIAAAHSVIENNIERKKKKLWTDREDGEKITYHRANDEREEAEFIAGEIRMLKNASEIRDEKPLKYSDFAILYRTNAQSRQFEDSFARKGIPYRVLSGLRYYDRKELKDMMAYMRLLVNPSDDLSLKRIINEPKRGMGAKSIEKIETFAGIRGESMFQALTSEDVLDTLPGKSYSKVKDLMDTMVLCRQEKENMTISDVYDKLLVDTGYLEALEKSELIEDESRIENLMEFKSAISDYENQSENPTLEEFMENLALMAEVDNHDETQDAVVLMTMHSAKGLEFPVVFMPGMEDGLFPGHRSLDSISGMEEERRLCYVGMTRAKQRLFLTSAENRMLYGRRDYTRESQFLRELDRKLVEGDGIFDRNGVSNAGRTIGGPGVSTGSADGFSNRSKADFKPFDALKAAKASTRAKAGSFDSDFLPGDRVSHGKFGAGTVRKVTGKAVTVEFDGAGEKKLAKGFAPLKKI